jgi:hypothetical protein
MSTLDILTIVVAVVLSTAMMVSVGWTRILISRRNREQRH